MNKKTKSTIVLTSMAAIISSTLLISGATYALFTSESKTNIAVTSGKVEVVATVKDFVTYSGTDLVGDTTLDESKIVETNPQGIFNNGGTAKYDEDTGSVILSNVTPGDRVSFTISVKNNSNVSVKYRTKISKIEDDGLFDSLSVTINGDKYDGNTKFTPYSNLLANTNPDDIYVVIDLPSDVDNIYQNKTCKIANVVEAIQANAHLDDSTSVDDSETLASAIAEGKPVSLSNDITLSSPLAITQNTTIYGNGKTLSSTSGNRTITLNDNSNVVLTLVDVNIDAESKERGLSIFDNTNLKLVLDNSSIVADHYSFNIGGTNQGLELIIKNNSKIIGYGAFNVFSEGIKVVAENSTFIGLNKWSGSSDDFATIVLNNNSDGIANNCNFSFTNCDIFAYKNGSAEEQFLRVKSANSTLSFVDCGFYYGTNYGLDNESHSEVSLKNADDSINTTYASISNTTTLNIE